MQNFPCVYLIFPRIWGRMDAPKERKTLWGICCYLFDFSRSDCFSCRSLSDSRNAAFLILTFGASTTLSDQILRTDGARSVSMNPHSPYRRFMKRLYTHPQIVQTRLIAFLQTNTQNRTDEVKFDSGTSAALSDRKKQ